MTRIGWVGLVLFILALLLAFTDYQVGRVAGSTSGFVFGQVMDEGVGLTVRPYLDFTGTGITCADASTSTQCTIPGASGVTAVTGTSPISSSGGTTPDISCAVASGAQAGCLSSADWTTFNNKVSTTLTLIAGVGLSGGGNLSADRTFTFDATELANVSWNLASASFTHTFDTDGTDPVWTYTSGFADLTTGTLRQGGTAVALSGCCVTSVTGGTGITSSGGLSPSISFDATELGALTWGLGSGFAWTFNASAGADATLTFGDGSGTFVGTWAATTITGANVTSGADPGHSHTGASLSAIDIGDDTNLAAGRSLTMSGDSVEADAELYTASHCIWFENPTAADDFKSIWRSKNAVTLTSLWAESNQTVTFMLQVDDGSPADVDTVDLAPAAGEAEDTSLDGDTTMAAGDRLDIDLVSVSGTPTWVSICWTFTRDD